MAESKQMPERILVKADEQHEINLHGEWYHQGGVVASMSGDEIEVLALTEYIRADLAPSADVDATLKRIDRLVRQCGIILRDPGEFEDGLRRILEGDTQ